jgi:hypothetical protein
MPVSRVDQMDFYVRFDYRLLNRFDDIV